MASSGRNGGNGAEEFLPIGIYGWRKRCLYFFILLLLVIIVVNLALTVWILVVTNFNVDGMGELRITDDGIAMNEDSKAQFLGDVYASSIKTLEAKPLVLESATEVALKTDKAVLNLTTSRLTATAASFRVSTVKGENVLTIDDGGTRIRTDLTSEREIVSPEIVTSRIRALTGTDLHVEGRGRGLSLQGKEVSVNAFGGVDVRAIDTISLAAETIVLNSNVQVSGVPEVTSGGFSSASMYEVCACKSNSMLYLSLVNPNGKGGCASSNAGICQ